MGKLRFGIFFFLGIIAMASCEKDDICVDGDTPLLVIEFFDIADTAVLKNVPNLRVTGVGQTINANTVSSLNTITIPLKTDEDAASFLLVADSAIDENGAETGNIDTLTFSYTRLEDFVSRACGFIVTYDGLTTALQTDADNWIQDIEVVQSEIMNSDVTHVKIFH